MNITKGCRWHPLTAIITALLLTIAPLGFAAQKAEKPVTATDVGEKVSATYQTMKSYTLQQRDEAVAAAKKRLAELDRQMDQLQKSLDEHWQDMSAEARKKKQQTLNALERQRREAAEWYGGMRHSSGEAWEEVKQGFADSYDRLEKAFGKAKNEFDKKE